MNFANHKLNNFNNFLSKKFINKLNSKLEKELKFIQKDYNFINLEKSLTKQTLLSRALAYRFFDDSLKIFLEKKINGYQYFLNWGGGNGILDIFIKTINSSIETVIVEKKKLIEHIKSKPNLRKKSINTKRFHFPLIKIC